jgi:hypothetical protein
MTTLHLSHKKNENCEFQKYVKVVSIFVFRKISSNDKFISEVHSNFLNTYNFIIFTSFK